MAGEGRLARRAADTDHRSLLLPLDLLPGAERRPVRDRDTRPGVHVGRAARDARRAAVAAARLRAASPRAGEAPHALAEHAMIFAERPAAGEAEGALVLVHGRGVERAGPRRALRRARPRAAAPRILAQRGPLSLPPGGAHWYAVHRVGFPDPETFAEGYASLTGFVDSLPYDRVVIGGFSQGAVMSFAVGLGSGRPRPLAVIGFSGFVPIVDGLGARRGAVPSDRGRSRHLRPGDPDRARPALARRAPRGGRRGPLSRVADGPCDRPGVRRRARALAGRCDQSARRSVRVAPASRTCSKPCSRSSCSSRSPRCTDDDRAG